jgi:poly-gamma-glutamate synthesis protein (capsule biosynthesis protein)
METRSNWGRGALALWGVIYAAAGCAAPGGGAFLEGEGEPRAACDAEDCGEYVGLDPSAKHDGFEFSNAPLTFGAACAEGERITIAAVGDVLLHGPLQQQAYSGSDGFRSLWADALPLLANADVTYANLEGATAAGVSKSGRAVPDPGKVLGEVYSSYPQFNYHPSLVEDLLASGVDVVSTANNHSMDRHSLGVDRTIDALEAAGMAFTGTRRRGETRSWAVRTTVRGVRLSWIACTYGTNGIRDPHDQVFLCFQQRSELLSLVSAEAARSDVDAVIVTPHWGDEYHATPNRAQVELGHDLLEAGALAVIGSHPHVLQPWEKYVTTDGREGFVIYSLGNFVSNQTTVPKRSTLLLYLGLTKGRDGVVRVHGARYVPMYMLREGRRMLAALDPDTRYRDSFDLTVSMFGGYNAMFADEPIVLDPQCDPAWTAPRLTPPFVGDACARDAECDFAPGAFCHAAGFCTLPCDGYCPDRADRALTFCAEDPHAPSTGICTSRSSGTNGYCAAVPGTSAREAERFVAGSGAASATATACLP